MERRHFSNIADFNSVLSLPPPEHPMLSFHRCRSISDDPTIFITEEPIIFSSDFYSISYKKFVSGDIQYGRTKYDYQNGALLFTSPRQEVVVKGVVVQTVGSSLYFHEDWIKKHEIRNRIRKYSFFSYSVNEALHLSPREEKLIESMLTNIESEYHANPDEFSKDILLSHIDTLLKYANRYYKRQFRHRTELSSGISFQFEQILSRYYESGQLAEKGLPLIEDISEELGMSARYLSDLLKAETGKSAMDHLHGYLLEEAKNLLLDPTLTVSETAFKLGFDYPNYFSRLFKKKVGMSPVQYRNSFPQE